MRAGRLASIALLGFVLAWWFAWQVVLPPPLTCDLPQRPELCKATSNATWEGLYWRRPIDIRVHEVPDSWRQSGDPRFTNAEWAVTLRRYADPSWGAACHLVDGHATCYAEQDMGMED
jgi:hypothetical protein